MAVRRYLETASYFGEAAVLHGNALECARQSGDRLAEARELNTVAVVKIRQGRLREAHDHFTEALGIFEELGDKA
ncbi:MAG TPA: tetratricopeptide repeat protein, partial [Steroidobacteraceae bacterium]|nr:tetratricopeptide repeat protein [Steroidobacteraceae bacterium]